MSGQTELLEGRLFEMFAERFKKFSLEFNHRNSRTFPASEHFVDNDSSTTHIRLSEGEMRDAWLRHVRGLGCKMTYARSAEVDMIYVRDYSDSRVYGRLIEIPKEVAIKILALGYIA